jgi:hypothetical protein
LVVIDLKEVDVADDALNVMEFDDALTMVEVDDYSLDSP